MEKTQIIYERLQALHRNPICELEYKTSYQLLVAVILSAQCTDKRVNIIAPSLFAIAPTPELMIQLSLTEVEEIIKSCGFYHNKAKKFCGKLI